MSWIIPLLLVIHSFGVYGSTSRHTYKHKERENDHDSIATCRDTRGKAVDWWILLKANGSSSQYTLFTSEDAKEGRTIGSKLSENFKIDDPKTSAFLRTVYGSMGHRQDVPLNADNRVFLAWNDQQPRPGVSGDGTEDDEEPPEDPATAEALESASADTASQNKTSKTKKDMKNKAKKEGDDKDMYGQGENMASAHSKGMIGLAVVDLEGKIMESGSLGRHQVEGFFINHSFPRTPNALFDENAAGGLVYRRQLPEEHKFFGKNIRNPQSKGQHAVCLSFTQIVNVSHGEILYNRRQLDRASMNLFALLDGLDTIGPAMVMTTYLPWIQQHQVWHQIFDVRSVYDSKPLTIKEDIWNLNIPRVNSKNAPWPSYSTHAFPLWPSLCKVEVDANGKVKYTKSKKTVVSLRAPGQMKLTRCPGWSAEGDQRLYDGCFTSIILTTTSKQYQIAPAIDFKNAMVIADVDDIIGARMVPLADVAQAARTSAPDRPHYVSLMVVTQSWIDSGTFGSSSRYLVDTPALKVKAWFHNNHISHLPSEKDGVHAQPSAGTDHSKWFIASYLYGQKGSFVPLAGFMDLNRNTKATKLPNTDHGRGGMFIFFHDPLIVSYMMKLNPIVADNSSRTVLNTAIFSSKHLYQPIKMGTVSQFNQKGSGMAIKYGDDPQIRLFHIPYIDVPVEVRNQLVPSSNITRQSAFLLGSHEPETGTATPPRMKSQPAARKRDEFETDEEMESSFSVFDSLLAGQSEAEEPDVVEGSSQQVPSIDSSLPVDFLETFQGLGIDAAADNQSSESEIVQPEVITVPELPGLRPSVSRRSRRLEVVSDVSLEAQQSTNDSSKQETLESSLTPVTGGLRFGTAGLPVSSRRASSVNVPNPSPSTLDEVPPPRTISGNVAGKVRTLTQNFSATSSGVDVQPGRVQNSSRSNLWDPPVRTYVPNALPISSSQSSRFTRVSESNSIRRNSNVESSVSPVQAVIPRSRSTRSPASSVDISRGVNDLSEFQETTAENQNVQFYEAHNRPIVRSNQNASPSTDIRPLNEPEIILNGAQSGPVSINLRPGSSRMPQTPSIGLPSSHSPQQITSPPTRKGIMIQRPVSEASSSFTGRVQSNGEDIGRPPRVPPVNSNSSNLGNVIRTSSGALYTRNSSGNVAPVDSRSLDAPSRGRSFTISTSAKRHISPGLRHRIETFEPDHKSS